MDGTGGESDREGCWRAGIKTEGRQTTVAGCIGLRLDSG